MIQRVKVVPESTWTSAKPWCPHPEHWHSTDPQSTEIEVSELVMGFIRALQPDYVIETGSCLGQTSQAIGLALYANGHGRLDTLEPAADRAEVTRARCTELPVTVHEVASLDFLPAQRVDFAWLDSRFELRIPEFMRYRDWMEPGAIVGFHDTAPHHAESWGEMIDAVDGLRSIRLRTPRGVTFAEVTA